jgi:hypothetical protein
MFRDLSGAENLEVDFILPSIRQFNGRRIDALIRRNSSGTPVALPGGLQEITDGRRALRSVFVTTEYNIASSKDFSGLHPFPAKGNGPAVPLDPPDTFFLNANLLAGGGPTQYQGLGISEARSFGSLLKITPAEYKKLIDDSGVAFGTAKGDANFAWFVPEASHSDNHLVDSLIKRGVVTPQFVAAALAVDLETPVFSTRTPVLLKFIPATFRFKPRNSDDIPAAHPDALTKAVIKNLEAAGPAAGTPEADFIALLKDPDPVKALRGRTADYLARIQGKLENPSTRQQEIDRLFGILIARRKIAANDPVLQSLNEFRDLLFPLP